MSLYSFSPNTVIESSKVNANFEGLADGSEIQNGVITNEHHKFTIGAKAYRNAAFIITGGGGAEKLSLDAEVYDVGSDYDTTNGRFVAPVTGYYLVAAQIGVNNSGLSEQVIISIYVNGASYSLSKAYGTSTTDDPASGVTDIVYATAGQYIEMYVDATANVDVQTGSAATYMSVTFLGAP